MARSHLLHGAQDHAGRGRRPAGVLPPLKPLVDVLDDDDGRVDHRTDGDRDAAERHDVGA